LCTPQLLTNVTPRQSAIEAYEAFDGRERGWINVDLKRTDAEEKAARKGGFHDAR
jgi:hypothetical protein